MASTQEAEIIFAQKLASNEKPIRSKALLKLRKYISVRSERGGFSEVELLKIWKGLFYCLWMQDMPVLQEELSRKISALLHSFRTVDSQLLYFKTFLQTVKREWNGIDRLRMDKFFQLVRFFFREVFEMLRRQDWKSSLVNEFLELISEQLLQSSSSAPSGLILHILDLYMSELAVIGSDTLTAEQNLTFIEPFCKTLAKTKDRVMLKAIGSNIFNTIVDQVPYAVEDLLREIQESGSEHDSQGSEDHMGHDDDDDDEDQEEDSGVVEDMKDVKSDGECGPVLQFDYGAIADRLFQLASHTNIPSFNRSKIYKFVKIFRDLAEGFFPQDEIEEVSTDDEDEDDNRRRKKKKRSKKQTDKADEKSSETTAESDPSQDCKQEKKKKRKKKRSKSVEDQTGSDANRPAAEDETSSIPQNTHTKALDEKDSSDLRPVKEECGADEDTNINSVLSPALQKKKRKLKKKKIMISDVNDGETTDDVKQENCSSESDITSAPEHTSREEEPSSSDPTTPLKKRKLKKKKKKNTSDVNDGEKTDDVKQEENCISTAPEHTSREEEPSSDPTTPLKKRKTKRISTDEQSQNKMTVRKSQRVRGVKSEAEESDEKHINISKKKMKKKPTSVELNGDATERKTRKRNMINGHTDTESEKRPKTISDEGFVFSEKKSPTALFCRSTRTSRRQQSITSPKSETKKVTFGLKNNQTMEFRKMDRSSLVSPAGPSRVAFDPKKTPKSGVLKSPTSSPAIRKRFTAADFF